MPRAPPGLSLLLMAALAFAATPPLETINPWLSACDLQPASATDLRGACSAMWDPGSSTSRSNSTTQCLLCLKESHKEKVCDLSPELRRDKLKELRLRHCYEHTVISALNETVLQSSENCRHLLDALLEVDALAARISCEFAEVLARYDCYQTYSIKHSCEDCKEAYRQWVCSYMVPLLSSTGKRMRPCRSVCQSVEQKCPYMLPGDRAPAHPTQYAGEPTFLCLDPNIPETGEQRTKSSVGEEDCCYTHCGTPGRGGLCVNISINCPSTEASTEPVRCSSGLGTNMSGCRLGASSNASRTKLNKVLPLWTAWIILIQINTHINILQCLLVKCATSVRTSLKRIKTKLRKRPWS